MIDREITEHPKLLRLRRRIGARFEHMSVDEWNAFMRCIDLAIADWSREERRRRKARKRRA